MFQSSVELAWGRAVVAGGEAEGGRWYGEASMVSRRRWCCAYISWYICTLRSKLMRREVYLQRKQCVGYNTGIFPQRQ